MRPGYLLPILASVSLLACDRPFGDPTEVARLYWVAMADTDVDKARDYATPGSMSRMDLPEDQYSVHGIELVSATVRGERATVPTRIQVTAGTIEFQFEFETTLRKEGDRWLVDARLTNERLAEGVVEAMIGGSFEGLGEALGGFIGEMVGGVLDGVGAALAEAGDALAEIEARPDYNYNYNFSHNTSDEGDWGDFDPGTLAQPVVSLTGVGDDETVSASFTLTRPLNFRVIALGEGSGSLVDYGWIVNQRTHQTVWEMDYSSTSHAGGAQKNRFVDELVALDAGTYVAYYTTDGSHSYGDWNSDAPRFGSYWGMTVVPASGSVDARAVRPYVPEADASIIARIDRVRDDQARSVGFTLDRQAQVRVYALGEGDSDGMYDYAWIENAPAGEVTWVMDYSDTQWAGGATKNRVVNETITLGPGAYVLRYRSDGSHSFSDWNDSPPRDPTSWGVTVYQTGR